jgi:hypothetical protein
MWLQDNNGGPVVWLSALNKGIMGSSLTRASTMTPFMTPALVLSVPSNGLEMNYYISRNHFTIVIEYCF